MASRLRLIPPSDLLERVEGVEQGLERGRRLGIVGWGAFAVSAGTAAIASFKSASSVVPNGGWTTWAVAVVVTAAVVGLLLVNWTRFWVRASREPFHYTYSIAPFERVEGAGTPPVVEGRLDQGGSEPVSEPGTDESSQGSGLAWLVLDLSERLSRRITRLSLLDERYSGQTIEPEAHIHIGGSYGTRFNAAGECVIEVLPWIRLGPTGSPATVGHLVRFALPPDGTLGPEEYEKVLERIYFSIATHLYGRIRKDVQRKIELLPKRYYRASAYFYEARDYSRSNTLDAYEQARDLYAEVLRLYDPIWWTWSPSSTRRALQRFAAGRIELAHRLRSRAAKVWPRLARIELMVARAEIGWSRTLLHRRALAGMSGQRLNTVFEALPVALSALERLESVPEDVPGLRKTRFKALVTLAAVYEQLGSVPQASDYLARARTLDPVRSEHNARYLHVRGRLYGAPRAIADLTRSVELDPAFEVAQLDLAIAVEMNWRSRATLEGDVADTVRREYDSVLTNNPGNITAWANLGYMHWLLDDPVQAKRAFDRGREYKEIKRETFVSELDSGLARIAAEDGRFKEAYRHYIDAASARFAQGVFYGTTGYTASSFDRITRDIVRRFELYRNRVHAEWQRLADAEPDHRSRRVRDAVYAFVLNDYAEACLNYFLRSGNRRFLAVARHALETADSELNARYAMIHYNLHLALKWDERQDDDVRARAGAAIDRAVELQPDWVDGKLQKAVWYRSSARAGRESADRSDDDAGRLRVQADALRREARTRRAGAKEAQFGLRLSAQDDLWSLATLNALPESSERSPFQSPLYAAGSPEQDEFADRAFADGGVLGDWGVEPDAYAPLTGRRVDLEAAGDGLTSQARDLLEEARRLRASANQHRLDATKHEYEVARILGGLLPHAWLRTSDGGLDLHAFSGAERPRPSKFEQGRARRLQRELDDIHVLALVEWALLESSTDDEHETSEPREDGEPTPLTPGTRAERASVLEFVRTTFLPANVDVLLECRDLCADPQRAGVYDETLRNVIRSWIELEQAWWSLNWVDWGESGGFSEAEARKILVPVARTGHELADKLCLELGTMLDALGEDALAKSCYSRVANSALADAAVLVELAERYDQRGDLEDALDACRLAERFDARDGSGACRPGEHRRRAARALWRLERYGASVEELDRVEVDDLAPGWRRDFVEDLIDHRLVQSPDAYRLLKDWLGRAVTSHRRDAEVRGDAAAALLLLTLRRYHQLLRRRHQLSVGAELAELMTPSASQVTLEADESFFPEGRDTPEVRRLLNPGDGEIARARTDIKRRTGVVIPTVTIHSTAGLGGGRYNVLVEGVPVATARLGSETRFCPVDRKPDGSRGRPGVNPRQDGSRTGVWLDEGETVPDGVEVWDRYRYMIEHVEAVLLRSIDSMYGVQELEDALSRDASVEGPRVRLAVVVRALLREGFSLPESLGELSELVEAHDTDRDIQDVVEAARLVLAGHLFQAGGLQCPVAVHPRTEDEIARWTHTGDGKRFLALPATEIETLRRQLSEQLDGEHGDALVVRARHLRRFVRRLTEIDRPEVPVVAFGELPENRRLDLRESARPVSGLGP